MKHRISIAVHFLALFSCFITIAVNFAAAFGSSWWKFGTTSDEFGILRICKQLPNDQVECEYRDNVFSFEYMTVYKELKPDIILILIIVSTSLAILGMMTSLLMLSCRAHRKSWFLGCVATGLLTLVGAVAGFVAVIYAYYYGDKLAGYKQGWPAILSWLSATTLLFSCIFTFLLMFLPPKGQDGGVINVRPSASNYPIFIHSNSLNTSSLAYSNRGYNSQ